MHQHAAALAHRGLQRGQEADGQRGAGREPDAGENRGAAYRRCGQGGPSEAPAAAGRWSRGRHWRRGARRAAPRSDRTLARSLAAGRGSKVGSSNIGGAGGATGGAAFVAHRSVAAGIGGRVADVQGFLDRRKRNFCGVFDLFRSCSPCSVEPSLLVRVPREPCALRKPADRIMPLARIVRAVPTRRLVRHFRNILLAERRE